MKKRKLISVVAAFTAAVIIFSPSSFGTGEEYNDKNYKTYGNLSENSEIPSLFKNDDVFENYKNYPPVISDGIEYVPLELFYGLSDFKINYSDDNSNFYIQNKKTNEYVSFSINDSYAVTGKNKVYEADVPVFYGVQYVPLRTVCDNVGIGCSTYNDGENKVYAIEIYTKEESLSAQELLQIHAPELYTSSSEPVEEKPPEVALPETGVPQSSPVSYPVNQTQEPTNAKPETKPDVQPDEKQEVKEQPKAPEYKKGTVMFFYTPEHFENAEKTLDALDELGISAVFFVTEENILEYPGTVRRIYTSGHTLGIALQRNEDIASGTVLEETLESAENALYEVAKVKTRIVYLGEDGKDIPVLPDDAEARIEKMGLYAVKFNGDAETDKLSAKKAAENMRQNLIDIRRSFGSETAYIRLHHTDSAIATLGSAAAVSAAYPAVKIRHFDETHTNA